MRNVTEPEAWANVASAIVGKAAEDYVNAHLFSTVDGVDSRIIMYQCEEFFMGDRMQLYTNAEGSQIIDALKKKANKILLNAKNKGKIPERYRLNLILEENDEKQVER